ncbi:uncharacterized protein LACBIDRAFT_316980 [Laccaria bicolor S238N-H82]|uniref:Predicted protein n=1 Tax=Laccaria bicolor (strain S238N-H82 / ATCC MYA-4686) TaxID=486041 RepID=B0D438_LACBS|nr:uncharacterized protein LACBIDRAFT_316980 [Laccaria bicolor S238N-H82]EDR10509.1 predicted protein [Laccaria bicolor S238N-H82]|eukprot:XP_001878959.1 predicted protein [Laccaria bicolor S238N-H82]
MYKHLSFLFNFNPETSFYGFVNTFLFRLSTMAPSQKVVIMMWRTRYLPSVQRCHVWTLSQGSLTTQLLSRHRKSQVKSHIRGALTTGIKWYFIVVHLNADDDGGTYWVTEPIEWRWKTKQGGRLSKIQLLRNALLRRPLMSPILPSILSSWVTDTFTEFGGDQWFNRRL